MSIIKYTYPHRKKIAILLVLNLFCCSSMFATHYSKQDSLKDKGLNLNLEDVKVMSSFSNRKGYEPVSLSTIYQEDIQSKLGSQEFCEVMKSTPSIYATKQGGGFGDSRIVLRGFDSSNIPILINGIPVNGMENGSVYWSNWAGLSDVASAIQVQRGVGLSKLGLFSAGGTINIITQSPTSDPKGQVFFKSGADGLYGYGVSYSTGDLPKGWNLSFMGTKNSGDGYVNGTQFEVFTYHVNITKHFNKGHKLSLIAYGSPQTHNKRGNKHYIEDYENHKDGIKMNTSYGYMNGDVVPTYGGYNEYHKPVISINHFWTISEKSYMSNVFYVSNATGGGRKAYGADAGSIQYNYKDGRPGESTDLTPEGYIDYEPQMDSNSSSKTGSTAIFTMGTNSHDSYGLLSTYGNNLTDNLKLTSGIDMRYYVGYHYDEITDLLGGEYFLDNTFAWRDPNQKLGVGDKVAKDYFSEIMWSGLFTQLQYEKNNFTAFVSGSLTSNMYKRTDRGRFDADDVASPSLSTEWNNFLPFSVKAGLNYRFAELHNVYINGGYSTRAPSFENIFVNNIPIADPINEKIATVELGYGIVSNNFTLNLTAYYTEWLDKSIVKAMGSWNGPKAYIPNVNARHMGLELDVRYEPAPFVRLEGFFTIGDWRWTNDVSYTMVDDDNTIIGEYDAFIKDLKVGNSPQLSAMLSANFIPFKQFVIGADLNYYGMHYADFSPGNRVDEDDRSQAWQLPNYFTVDINSNYKIDINSDLSIQIFMNINNLFDTEYVSDALDGVDHNKDTALVWYGFGRTWVAGMKVNF